MTPYTFAEYLGALSALFPDEVRKTATDGRSMRHILFTATKSHSLVFQSGKDPCASFEANLTHRNNARCMDVCKVTIRLPCVGQGLFSVFPPAQFINAHIVWAGVGCQHICRPASSVGAEVQLAWLRAPGHVCQAVPPSEPNCS